MHRRQQDKRSIRINCMRFQDIIVKVGTIGPLYVMGNWNVKLDERTNGEEDIVGPRVPRKEGMLTSVEAENNRNRIVEMAATRGMVVSDTWFDKREERSVRTGRRRNARKGRSLKLIRLFTGHGTGEQKVE